MRSALFCYCLLVSLTSSPGATVINIDFQVGAGRGAMTGNSGAVIPFVGWFWNANGPNGQAMPLLSSTGDPTGLELIPSVYEGRSLADGDALFGDYVYGDATIRGLDPGQDYLISIYSAANLQGIFRVAQPFDTSSPGYGEVGCTYEHTVLPGVEGCDYVVGMPTADIFGEIRVSVQPGAMSGMQIVLNPEPSVTMLNLIAGLGLALRRRRGAS